ncbi:hypothetical protein E2C01_082301 [Portunus trituberculatus]|uniref:Uncharacterized protein n=1 Tax=Portunus trituberculatus TaxID=210409 RepID=A0A5B7IYP9_PORTR|nr:hypothetical protein [Portunus trituberculatus]
MYETAEEMSELMKESFESVFYEEGEFIEPSNQETQLATLIRSKHMPYVTVSPTPTMDGGSDSDFTVSDSATSPACLTSTPRISCHVAEKTISE